MGKTLIGVAADLAGCDGERAGEAAARIARSFFEATRANLERSQSRQSGFSYVERRRELHTNPFGRLGSGTGTEEYRVEPQPDGSIARTLDRARRRRGEERGDHAQPAARAHVAPVGRGRHGRRARVRARSPRARRAAAT